MDDPYPSLPWPFDADDLVPDTDQRAFAAYEDAWAQRDASGQTSPDLLTQALKHRKVPRGEYAPGTRLHRALFDSWERGRRPQGMHGVILRYRLGKLADIPSKITEFFRDSTPEHMRVPEELRSADALGDDESGLPFSPTGTFAARVGSWYDAIDDDGRERALPVWLDTGAYPQRTPVMIGRELAGHTQLPPGAHARLLGATKRGKRIVVTGDLWVKRRKDGTFRATSISAVLPDPRG